MLIYMGLELYKLTSLIYLIYFKQRIFLFEIHLCQIGVMDNFYNIFI
jgi:hypothetical protein